MFDVTLPIELAGEAELKEAVAEQCRDIEEDESHYYSFRSEDMS